MRGLLLFLGRLRRCSGEAVDGWGYGAGSKGWSPKPAQPTLSDIWGRPWNRASEPTASSSGDPDVSASSKGAFADAGSSSAFGEAKNPSQSQDPEIGKVPFGGSDLADAAYDWRVANNEWDGNIAAFKHKDGSIFVFKNIPQWPHAERVGGYSILDPGSGVDPDDITHIYSELQPCKLPGPAAGCDAFLQKNFPNAKVSWSIDYDDDASRALGRQTRTNYLNGVRGIE